MVWRYGGRTRIAHRACDVCIGGWCGTLGSFVGDSGCEYSIVDDVRLPGIPGPTQPRDPHKVQTGGTNSQTPPFPLCPFISMRHTCTAKLVGRQFISRENSRLFCCWALRPSVYVFPMASVFAERTECSSFVASYEKYGGGKRARVRYTP